MPRSKTFHLDPLCGNPTDPAIHEMRPLSTQTMGEHHGHQELWVQRPYTYTILYNHIDSHKFQRNGRKNLCFWLNHRGRFARVYGPSLGMLGTYMVSKITNRAIVVKNTLKDAGFQVFTSPHHLGKS